MYKYLILLLALSLFTNASAQHDPGRNAVRRISHGKIDSAVNIIKKGARKKNSPLNQAEKNFVLAMAACRVDNPEIAARYAAKAVKMGLPIQRIQAGPRKILAPLYHQKNFKTWLNKKKKKLIHGPMLGSVTDSRAKFWLRTEKEENVKIAINPLRKTPSGTLRLTGQSRTSSKKDYTTTIEVSGLKPDTQYQYHLLINGRKHGLSAVFRTCPEKGKPCKFSIAFGGGAGFTPRHERMWNTIAGHNPRALLMLGDNVYIDDPARPATQKYCYYRRQSQPEWRKLVASTSTCSIYDDHDFGTNDCVPGPRIEKPQWKRKVWNVFKQNWNNPAYAGGEETPGCWYSFYIGNVHFIMLDCRYYRDLEGGSMLGPVQKKWLLHTLKNSNGKFKVLASSVPWSLGVKPHRNDTWDGFEKEREQIFSFIHENRINGVLLMAADRHRSDFRRIPRSKGYDFYEVMSSRLTNIHTHNMIKNAKGSDFIMGYNEKCSFGLLQFDTTEPDPQVTYKIINIDNQLIAAYTLKLSHLFCN